MRPLAERFGRERPQWRIRVWPEPGFDKADVVIGWNCPVGLYAAMPQLRLVHGIAAGVDNLITGQDLRDGLHICRVIDDGQAQGMVDYVLWSVLHFQRGFDHALANQSNAKWIRPDFRAPHQYRVGLMGLGSMGAQAAKALVDRGYRVSGWSRSPREIEGVTSFSSAHGLQPFLSDLDIVVCLLPLTEETRGILCHDLFRLLPCGAALVNVGRGEHLIEGELREALDSGHLRGAILDVFGSEPLPPDNTLWSTPGVIITPHMATKASQQSILGQVLDNVARLQNGEPLLHRVDLGAGY